MKKRGAIFDLDGTLVDTTVLHEQAWVRLFRRYDLILTPDELREQSGKKNDLFISIVAKRYGRSDIESALLALEKDVIVLELLGKDGAPVFDDAKELLKGLRDLNRCMLALATSGMRKTARAIAPWLDEFFLTQVFFEDVRNGKPHPEIFLRAADGLGLAPSECVVFEDAQSGIQAAKAGGFYCIARDTGNGQDLSEADLIVSSYDPVSLLKLFR